MIQYVECTCKPDEAYADGTMPVFHTDSFKAQYWYQKLKKAGGLYWGVHLNGLHLVGKP